MQPIRITNRKPYENKEVEPLKPKQINTFKMKT